MVQVTRVLSSVGFLLLLLAARSAAQSAVVRLEAGTPTLWGESVYVLGNRPELGAWDVTRAVRMVPAGPGRWSLDVALPAGAPYEYVVVVRQNDPGRVADRGNARFVSGVERRTAPGTPSERQVRVRYLSGFTQPRLRFERASGQVEELPFRRAGPGRGAGEWLWEVVAPTGLTTLEFVPQDGGRTDLAPGGGAYHTTRSAPVLVDGRILSEVPTQPATRSRIEVVRGWWSNRLGNARDVTLYLPRGYDASNRRYPVLYMHDGQNLFGHGGPFGSWSVDTTADALIDQGLVEDLIIVAVSNTQDRMREYMPPEDGGAADRYAAFLVDELKPWVDGRLRTRPEREHTGIAGSSLGGLVSLYAAWERPDVFGRVASLSGSFWKRGWLDTLQVDAPRRGLRAWLDSGNAGHSADSAEDTLAARDLLLGKGMALGRDLEHRIYPGAEHNEAAWRARFGDALRFLFPAE